MSFNSIPATQTCSAASPGACCGTHDLPDFPEPSLDELLDDPIVRLVMQQDGVTDLAIRRLMAGLGTGRPQSRREVRP